ncbi:hypothetical protein LXA43DRAFT_88805 [Ganoderma leucocontextum]|nr:hypothetical protein LXA43DRAFT_88805 [Ganoderma leucocontextum]
MFQFDQRFVSSDRSRAACHIPPVSEEEILERITFDNQGKRDAGLSGWQCKRCTKRARVEPPSPVAASGQSVGVSAPAPGPQLQSKSPLNGSSNSPTRTTSSVPPQASPSAPAQAAIAGDDDIIILSDDGHGPERSQQSVADLGNKPQVKYSPAEVQPTVDQQRRMPDPPATQQAPAAASDGPAEAQKTVKLSKTAQKRPAKSQLIITPLPTSRGSSTKEPGPNAQPNHTLRSSSPSPPPPPPAPESEQVSLRTRSPTPTPPPRPIQPEPTVPHISFAAPASTNVKTISTADIRALISTMRSDGRLAPPPDVEYIHTHTRPLGAGSSNPRPLGAGPSNPRPPRSGARKLAYTPERTHSRELDEVERKLEDFDSDAVAMDVDRRSASRLNRDSDSDAMREEEEEEDPHNIDDLYGDIAPRYRSQPSRPSKSRSKAASAPRPRPPAETRLLFAERDKRPPKADDLGRLLDKKLRIEGRRRGGDDAPLWAPRKAAVTQRLKGKALMRKQETGLYFSIHEERKRAAGGWPVSRQCSNKARVR